MVNVGEKQVTSKQMGKLKPWLNQAQKNITHSQKIIKELERIKILDIKKTTFSINRSTLITREKIQEFEQMMKPKAIFLTSSNDVQGLEPRTLQLKPKVIRDDSLRDIKEDAQKSARELKRNLTVSDKIEQVKNDRTEASLPFQSSLLLESNDA